ncbi:hypothetical protein C0992_005510 [Termitomyces sp. T32_za158]|nr:hypothetical protein C0992_005510 [Termitomyces sp. T32_za158]
MYLYTPVIAVAFLLPVFAAPSSLVPVEKVDGETSGRHIVRLRSGIDRSSFVLATNIVPTHNWTVINGFAGKFTKDQINMLRENSDVESIAEDGVAQASQVANGIRSEPVSSPA